MEELIQKKIELESQIDELLNNFYKDNLDKSGICVSLDVISDNWSKETNFKSTIELKIV